MFCYSRCVTCARKSGRLGILALLLSGGALAWQAPQQPAPATSAPAPSPSQQAPVPAAQRASETVVIDPGHGGADAGARGSSGILEKDVTMFLAVLLRDELQRQGLRAAITRQSDENPTFDDRAAFANSFARPIFISLHAGSTGQPGTARTYYSRLSPSAASGSALVPWDSAQERHVDESRRLAQQVQVQLKERFERSPQNAAPGALRQLKSVAGPAIAVEIASVSVKERAVLDQMVPGLVAAILRGVTAFRGASAAPGAP